jgi:hypothetical protein
MSTVKVNTVDKRTGGTLTLGGCGTTVTLGAGATQSGFGRTGTVDWCTTAKTAPFTGVSGNGYFVNTTSGVVTVTLPATPSAGDIISVADYASTFQTNNVTLCNNSSKINGVCATASLSTQGQSITLVYVDATRGWKNTMDSTSNVTATPNYIVATGGTITCCGDYKIHTFTSDGCFSVSNAGNPAGSNTVDYLVVAGGGGGGQNGGGGGGAGGYRESSGAASGCYSVSPLGSGVSALPVSATTYPITVGGGGSGAPDPAVCGPGNSSSGSGSIFSTITSTGGGLGGSALPAPELGGPGGSGGGALQGPAPAKTAGTGNTPPTSPPQGNDGATHLVTNNAGTGGGGATSAGSSNLPTCQGGAGGAGATTSISGSPTAYAGGGGGGGYTPGGGGPGGLGGGGNGGGFPVPSSPAIAGTTNTGGGGGGGSAAPTHEGKNGGSGIVIVRYKFQN